MIDLEAADTNIYLGAVAVAYALAYTEAGLSIATSPTLYAKQIWKNNRNIVCQGAFALLAQFATTQPLLGGEIKTAPSNRHASALIKCQKAIYQKNTKLQSRGCGR